MKKTNVFATKEEIEQLKSILNTPVMMMTDKFFEQRQKAEEVCHGMALKHGLSEIKGYYGILGTGEFVSD